MMIVARIFLASCPACLSFQTACRRAPDPIKPFCAWEKNDVVALDRVCGQTALPTTARGNRVIVLMLDLFI